MLLVVLVIFHGPLFRFLAGLLVVDDPLESADAVVVAGTSGPYAAVPFDELADLYHKGLARKIVLIEDRSSRIVEAGIIPTLETVVRRELAARKVPENVLTVRAGTFASPWDSTRSLRDWLGEHPEARVMVLCDQFSSRNSRVIVRSVLDGPASERVRWRVLPDRRYDVSNWWHTRQGITALVAAYVTLLHTSIVGEPAEKSQRWNPDQYQTQLRSPPLP